LLKATAKLSVREGITISADQPSAVFAVRASQIPSQSREALSGLSIKPSTRAPAALIWKKVAGSAVAVCVKDNGYRVIAGLVTIAPHGVNCNGARLWIMAVETEIDCIGRDEHTDLSGVRCRLSWLWRLLRERETLGFLPGRFVKLAVKRD